MKSFDAIYDGLRNEDTAWDETMRERLSELNVLEMTASELLELARRAGWDRGLGRISLDDLDRIVNLPEPEQSIVRDELILEREEMVARGRPRRKSGPRSAIRVDDPRESEMAQPTIPAPVNYLDRILAFVREQPWTFAAAVSEGVELSPDKTSEHIDELLQKDWLKTVGEGEETRYALG